MISHIVRDALEKAQDALAEAAKQNCDDPGCPDCRCIACVAARAQGEVTQALNELQQRGY